jgi:hypothetical protein
MAVRPAAVVGTPIGLRFSRQQHDAVASISALSTNALPVWRWQSRQWQQWTNIGAEVSR